MNPFALSGLLTFISALILGIFSLIKGKRFLHKIWSCFNFSAAIWGLGAFKFSTTLDQGAVFFWLRFGHIGVILLPVFFIHFIFELLEINKRKILYLVYAVGLFFSVLNITDWLGVSKLFIVNLRYVFNSFYVDSPPGYLYPFFVAFFFLAVIYGHYYGIKYLRISKGLKRMQIKYVLLGTAFGFTGGATAFLMVFKIDIYPFLHFTVPIYPIIMTYAIIKYRLIDIRVAAARVLVNLVVYTTAILVPLVIATKGKIYLQDIFGNNWWLIPLGLFAVLTTIAPYIAKFLTRHAEDRILKDRIYVYETLRDLAKQITLVRGTHAIAEAIIDSLSKNFKISSSNIYLLDTLTDKYKLIALRGASTQFELFKREDALIQMLDFTRAVAVSEEVKTSYHHSAREKELIGQLDKLGATIIIPGFVNDKLIMFIVLGEKSSGDMYTQDDIDELTILVDRAGWALEKENISYKIRESERLKDIGDMLLSLDHEMLNLFNNMQISMEMVNVVKTEEERNKKLYDISKNIQLGLEVLKGPKDYQLKSQLAEGPRDLSYDIRDGFGKLSQRYEKEGIELELEVPRRLPSVKGRSTLPDIFFHIGMNCYFNLLDSKEKKVEVKAIVKDSIVEIAIKDTGVDMMKELKSTMPTGGEYITARGKLGAINYFLARRITSDHKGSLEVESNKPSGTIFMIKLPVLETGLKERILNG